MGEGGTQLRRECVCEARKRNGRDEPLIKVWPMRHRRGATKYLPEAAQVERQLISERFPEVDYSKCKRYGPSYRALPKNVRLSVGRRRAADGAR